MSIQLFVNWKLHDKIDRPLHPDKSKERHVGYRAQLSAPRAAVSYALKLLSQHRTDIPLYYSIIVGYTREISSVSMNIQRETPYCRVIM